MSCCNFVLVTRLWYFLCYSYICRRKFFVRYIIIILCVHLNSYIYTLKYASQHVEIPRVPPRGIFHMICGSTTQSWWKKHNLGRSYCLVGIAKEKSCYGVEVYSNWLWIYKATLNGRIHVWVVEPILGFQVLLLGGLNFQSSKPHHATMCWSLWKSVNCVLFQGDQWPMRGGYGLLNPLRSMWYPLPKLK